MYTWELIDQCKKAEEQLLEQPNPNNWKKMKYTILSEGRLTDNIRDVQDPQRKILQKHNKGEIEGRSSVDWPNASTTSLINKAAEQTPSNDKPETWFEEELKKLGDISDILMIDCWKRWLKGERGVMKTKPLIPPKWYKDLSWIEGHNRKQINRRKAIRSKLWRQLLNRYKMIKEEASLNRNCKDVPTKKLRKRPDDKINNIGIHNQKKFHKKEKKIKDAHKNETHLRSHHRKRENSDYTYTSNSRSKYIYISGKDDKKGNITTQMKPDGKGKDTRTTKDQTTANPDSKIIGIIKLAPNNNLVNTTAKDENGITIFYVKEADNYKVTAKDKQPRRKSTNNRSSKQKRKEEIQDEDTDQNKTLTRTTNNKKKDRRRKRDDQENTNEAPHPQDKPVKEYEKLVEEIKACKDEAEVIKCVEHTTRNFH